MSVQDLLQQKEVAKAQSFALVRRFTEEQMTGETTLERVAISAHKGDKATDQADNRMRLKALYQDPDGDPR